MKVKDHLTIGPDGSGSVRIETTPRVDLDVENLSAALARARDRNHYPPLNRASALKLFPGDAFEVQVSRTEQDGAATTVVTATFTDVNALLRSPYAEAHDLVLQKDPKTQEITLRARSGLAALGVFEEMAGSEDREQVDPRIIDAAKAMKKMHQVFMVTVPGQARSDGGDVSGQTVTWT
ncbi:MAG: hypothetical protein R3236_07535, partial [Phycisphaeraceae bacterium]|nr:hypothetical protein [Phycisphaeraceae bacterium]